MPRPADVNPIDRAFHISTHEAEQLWQNGTKYQKVSGGKISQDGRWIIRSEETTIGAALESDEMYDELKKLRSYGAHAISHAFTPDLSGRGIYVVSPWLPNIQPCTNVLYKEVVIPSLKAYYRQKDGEFNRNEDVVFLIDIIEIYQHSTLLDNPELPFLHDIGISLHHIKAGYDPTEYTPGEALNELLAASEQNTNRIL